MNYFFNFYHYIIAIIAAIIGLFLIGKNSHLKKQNDEINNENLALKKQLIVQDEIDKELKDIAPADYADNSKRMRNNSL